MRWLFPMALLAAAPAAAQATCDTRTAILDRLGHVYGESTVGLGVSVSGGVMELLTSADGSSWSIITTMPNGTTCLIAAGQDWQPIQRKPVVRVQPEHPS